MGYFIIKTTRKIAFLSENFQALISQNRDDHSIFASFSAVQISDLSYYHSQKELARKLLNYTRKSVVKNASDLRYYRAKVKGNHMF